MSISRRTDVCGLLIFNATNESGDVDLETGKEVKKSVWILSKTDEATK